MAQSSIPPHLLTAFQRTADACTQPLRIPSHSTSSPWTRNASPDLTSILTDYTSLLSLIYTHTTTLSLAMKPPPTYPGATRPLSDLASDVTKLTSCVCFLSSSHGATLHKEATWRAQETIESIHTLIQIFISINPSTPSEGTVGSAMLVNIPGVHSRNTAADGNDAKSYLIRTGAVHSAVEHAKKTLSKSNAQAVLKVWNTHTESLQDALEECKELAMDPVPDDEDELDGLEDIDDDGWGELISNSHRKLAPEERERANKVPSKNPSSGIKIPEQISHFITCNHNNYEIACTPSITFSSVYGLGSHTPPTHALPTQTPRKTYPPFYLPLTGTTPHSRYFPRPFLHPDGFHR